MALFKIRFDITDFYLIPLLPGIIILDKIEAPHVLYLFPIKVALSIVFLTLSLDLEQLFSTKPQTEQLIKRNDRHTFSVFH